MDVREKLVELILNADNDENLGAYDLYELTHECTGCAEYFADYLIANGVTVQEWIDSEEMLPQFPCLALDVNGNSVFIPDGILTIKDNHGEWCIDASLAKEVRLVDGTKIDVLLWENRIAYWMPLPQPPNEVER